MDASNPSKTEQRRKTSRILTYVVKGIALIWVIVTTWVYWIYYYRVPHLEGDNANYLVSQLYYAFTLIAALSSAALGTLLTAQFKPGEPPYLVWLMFTIGWWVWAGAETCILVQNYVYWFDATWPDITVADMFYTVGYFFFMLALFFQFRLIYGRERKIGLLYYFIIVAMALLVTLGITQLTLHTGLGADRSWISLYQAWFYPVGDLAIGLAVIWLSILFGRGTWGRSWWGLIGFALADAINIFIWVGGDMILKNTFSNGGAIVETIDLLSTTIYTASYLFVAIAFLNNYNLIKYGPATRQKRSTIGASPTTPG